MRIKFDCLYLAFGMLLDNGFQCHLTMHEMIQLQLHKK